MASLVKQHDLYYVQFYELWLIPLFWFAFYTGMRASELARYDGSTSTKSAA